jgi:hypothetical protein
MSDNLTDQATVNRTRWGRSSVLMAGGLAGAAAIAATLMSTGAYASEFISTSAQSEITVYSLRTPHNTALVRGITTHDYNGNPDTEYVATFQVPSAVANTLCLTHKMEMLGQPVTLMIDIGDMDPTTTEIQVNGINLDILTADTSLTLFGDTSVNQAPSTMDISSEGAPTVDPVSDDEIGIHPVGGALLSGASATLLNAEVVHAEGIPTLDARLIMDDVDCAPTR